MNNATLYRNLRAQGALTLMFVRIPPNSLNKLYQAAIPKAIRQNALQVFCYKAAHGHKGRA